MEVGRLDFYHDSSLWACSIYGPSCSTPFVTEHFYSARIYSLIDMSYRSNATATPAIAVVYPINTAIVLNTPMFNVGIVMFTNPVSRFASRNTARPLRLIAYKIVLVASRHLCLSSSFVVALWIFVNSKLSITQQMANW